MSEAPAQIPGLPGHHKVIALDQVDSTNTEAMQRGMEGHQGPLWIMARQQLKGRGRTGRRWVSPPGNLHTSFLTTFTCSPLSASATSLVAGIALYDAVESMMDEAQNPVPLALKWPNDLLCYGQKLGGILVETARYGAQSSFPVVIGFGLNLRSAPGDLDQRTTSLMDQGVELHCDKALARLATSLDHWLGVWQEGDNMGAICDAWSQRGIALGARMRVHDGSQQIIEGRFAGLNKDGALLIDKGGEIATVTYGDVTLPDEKQ